MAEQETVVITYWMRKVIEHMLENPRGRYYATGIANAKGWTAPTIARVLRGMEAAGWLTSEWVPGAGSPSPRRYYRFTTGTAPVLRKALQS